MKGSVLGLRARPLIFTVVRLKACIKQKTGTEGKIENRKHCNLSMRGGNICLGNVLFMKESFNPAKTKDFLKSE